MATYVLVHGGGHGGWCYQRVARILRAEGHEVFTPTLTGLGERAHLLDDRVDLKRHIEDVVAVLHYEDLSDVILVGHSYGGMIITGVADRVPDKVRRLVYWNAFVPNNGECLNDMVPPHYVSLFDSIAAQRGDGSVVLPFPIWREAFINDVDLDTAQRAYDVLNPHPVKTFTDKISLKTNPADMKSGKSYINCTEDISLPHHHPWHPRLSQKLGLFRLVQVPGSHELCFSNPARLAQAIMNAGRD